MAGDKGVRRGGREVSAHPKLGGRYAKANTGAPKGFWDKESLETRAEKSRPSKHGLPPGRRETRPGAQPGAPALRGTASAVGNGAVPPRAWGPPPKPTARWLQRLHRAIGGY